MANERNHGAGENGTRWSRKVEPVGGAAAASERAARWAQEAGGEREWSWPEERRLIGKRIQRLDGPAKATGVARYAYDVNLPRMGYGKMVRSPHARARLLRLNTDAAEAAPGVIAIHPIAEEGAEVRYHGDPVAAVAAETENQARDAARLIRAEYEVLPHVSTPEEAMADGAPEVHEGGNLRTGRGEANGSLEDGFSAATAIYGGDFRTQVQTHASLETHGVVAQWDGDELTVWGSAQGVHGFKEGLAAYWKEKTGLDASKVRCICQVMGGGFGSKFGIDLQGVVCSELALAAGRPVKMLLERDEEHLDTGNRPSAVARVRAGADRDGKLVAFEAETYGTGGIGAGAGFPMPYIYEVANRRRRHHDVFVNAGSARAMRAPGHPQGSFITESVMDELAANLGMDPVALRKRNLPPDSLWQAQLDRGAADIGWDRWHAPGDPSPGPVKRGLGCACAVWGGGGGGTQAHCEINPDGSVVMSIGTQDIGTGTRTLVSIVTAEILGLPLEAITPAIGDSRYPFSGASGGSTTAASVTPAARVTAQLAFEELARRIAPEFGVDAASLEPIDGSVRVTGVPESAITWQRACSMLGTESVSVQGGWQPGLSSSGVNGAQFAAVSVDTETGIVTVDRIVVYQDCGMVVDLLTAESQVNGGVIMGIGFALFEERVLDPNTGRMLNADLEFYKLAGAREIPRIDVNLMDVPSRGVIGLGEPPTIPTAAAIANAVANAIGTRVHSLPITPDKVLAALHQGPAATLSPTHFPVTPPDVPTSDRAAGEEVSS
jgi:xanthine dehydrogenase YagR molybdenum-binding subunit